MRAALWNTRAALLYSLGGWTMLGAMIHYSSKSGADAESGGEPAPSSLENETEPETSHPGHQEIHTREAMFGLKVTTVVTYKDVQPPITRLLRHMTSLFDSNDGPPSER